MSVIKEYFNLPKGPYTKVEIPNCDRKDLPQFFKDMGCSVGVEIGVQRAAFTLELAKPGLKVYGVDPWLAYKDYYVDENFKNRQEIIYEDAVRKTKDNPDIILLRKTSMEALEEFEDESIDFVYIDGHHGFKYVTEDIFEWSKKVKKGGFISGHDYAYPENNKHEGKPYKMQTRWVIDAYTQAFNIPKWFVLGRETPSFEGEKRDKYRSWMWQKTWDTYE
jgi:hypothetical protein